MAPIHPSSSDPSTPDSGSAAQQSQAIQKSYSCVLCAQRKVKCDRAPGGCANCSKARVDCIYKAPPPPRRRKKGVREVDVHARLRIYEDALRRLGVEPDDLVKQEAEKASKGSKGDVIGVNDVPEVVLPEARLPEKKETSRGILVSGDGKSRYLENTLWTSLKSEFRDSNQLLEDSSSDDENKTPNEGPSPSGFSSDGGNMLIGTPRSAVNLRPLHPQPVQIFKLWQTYLDNINPLIKIFHTPTVQQIISNASGDLDDIPKNVEALLFSIYSVCIESLSESECDVIMGESKAVCSTRFKAAAQHALINASFLKTSDMMVLQALVLFLTAQQNYDARVIWILTGVAGRIGQRIGLHRDPETLDLPPFESEMRRRLWWQILMQDGFAEKLAGTGGTTLMGDVKRPSNLNDGDLFPGMKELPKEHDGATEMMFFLIRCHLGEFLKRSVNNSTNFDGVWNKLSTNAASIAVKDKAIDELETLFERKFLRYCDASVPWHFMCSYLAKAILSMLRFIAHNPEHHGAAGVAAHAQLPQSERDMLFNVSVQVVEYQNMAYTTKEMQGYLWHINSHFQWKGFIYFVNELRERTQGAEVDNAWKQVQLVYDFHPNFNKEVSGRALPIAVGNLTLKAWEAYVAARGLPGSREPYFIQVLRGKKKRQEAAAAACAARRSSAVEGGSTNTPSSSSTAPASTATERQDVWPSMSPSAANPRLTHPALHSRVRGFGSSVFLPTEIPAGTASGSSSSTASTTMATPVPVSNPATAAAFPTTSPSEPQPSFADPAFHSPLLWDTSSFTATLDPVSQPSLPIDQSFISGSGGMGGMNGAAGGGLAAQQPLPLLDPDQMNWSSWDSLLADFEMQGTSAFMGGGGGGDAAGMWEFGMG